MFIIGTVVGNITIWQPNCSYLLLFLYFVGGKSQAVAEQKNSDVEKSELLNILPIFKLYCDYLPTSHATWKSVTSLFLFCWNSFNHKKNVYK